MTDNGEPPGAPAAPVLRTGACLMPCHRQCGSPGRPMNNIGTDQQCPGTLAEPPEDWVRQRIVEIRSDHMGRQRLPALIDALPDRYKPS